VRTVEGLNAAVLAARGDGRWTPWSATSSAPGSSRNRPIPDPAAFSRRLASMMEKGLVA